MKVSLVFLGMMLISLCSSYPCVAAIGTWGPVCTSPVPLRGVKGTYANYHVTVYSATTVECQAVGMSNYVTTTQCKWDWHNLGVVNNNYVSLIWDTQNSYPAIRCKGSPFGSQLDWTWSAGTASLSCIRSDPFKNKISFDNEVEVDALLN